MRVCQGRRWLRPLVSTSLHHVSTSDRVCNIVAILWAFDIHPAKLHLTAFSSHLITKNYIQQIPPLVFEVLKAHNTGKLRAQNHPQITPSIHSSLTQSPQLPSTTFLLRDRLVVEERIRMYQPSWFPLPQR